MGKRANSDDRSGEVVGHLPTVGPLPWESERKPRGPEAGLDGNGSQVQVVELVGIGGHDFRTLLTLGLFAPARTMVSFFVGGCANL